MTASLGTGVYLLRAWIFDRLGILQWPYRPTLSRILLCHGMQVLQNPQEAWQHSAWQPLPAPVVYSQLNAAPLHTLPGITLQPIQIQPTAYAAVPIQQGSLQQFGYSPLISREHEIVLRLRMDAAKLRETKSKLPYDSVQGSLISWLVLAKSL